MHHCTTFPAFLCPLCCCLLHFVIFVVFRRISNVMAVVDEIVSGFKAININLSGPVLDKCQELCITYNIDPEDFIDQWLAYTASNLNGEPPSVEALDKMERKELQKQNKPSISKTPKSRRSEVIINETPPRKHNITMELQGASPRVSQIIEPPPLDTPSKQFIERSDARSVQCEFGDCGLNTFKERSNDALIIKVQNEDIANCKYMYEKLLAKQQSLSNMSRWVIGEIVIHHQLEVTLEKLQVYSGEIVICGRIYGDGPGKLNVQSILLEGTLEIHKGQTIKLNLDNLDKLALFSGQIVVLKGNNMKNHFTVSQLYTGAPLPLPETLPQFQENLQIVVAAGPFSLPDNLLYEPLDDLLKYVVEFKPNVLILMGPFMDASNNILETLNENFDLFFENIIDKIMERLKGSGVQVIISSSHKEIHNHLMFPSLPYKLRKYYENLILAPNPSILDIEGLKVGVSSADILFHINKSEVSRDYQKKETSDRMARLVSHIFNQRSFYPLHPPDSDIRIDYGLLEKYGMFEDSPHLMFLPSNFRYFMKKIDNCVVINPERLTKGTVAGTFARVEVRPGEGAVSDRISCQILRV